VIVQWQLQSTFSLIDDDDKLRLYGGTSNPWLESLGLVHLIVVVEDDDIEDDSDATDDEEVGAFVVVVHVATGEVDTCCILLFFGLPDVR